MAGVPGIVDEQFSRELKRRNDIAAPLNTYTDQGERRYYNDLRIFNVLSDSSSSLLDSISQVIDSWLK